ncbi:MAG: hypothetical protein J6A68_01165, partial [Oscillospiraceae bacterium]|nr:hypothetical protein [Oscillospiraceae bacterium]
MAGYNKLEVLLREELDQLAEEGKYFDRAAILKEIDEAAGDLTKLESIYTALQTLPTDENFSFVEPSEYDDICKES